ncbi:MAG TPA: AAA family ATPase [Saprospiraceae bacterium]|nr:AAA family ATPase [Saprospiraceae bacterium]
MKFATVKITNYKSYLYSDITFGSTITTLVGNNGMGKTNLLDAIYYLGIGKSYFTISDENVVNYDADFIRLEAYIDDCKIVNKNQIGREKTIEINGVPIEKKMDYVGRFPVVVIAPKDFQELIDTNEERRIFINNT